MSDDHHHEMGADEHALVALEAIKAQDYKHAVYHVAAAYFEAPMDEDYHQIFLRWFREVEDPVAAIQPPEGEGWSAHEAALLAEIYAQQGQEDLAIYWLSRVIEASKNMALLERAMRWLSQPEARARVGTDSLTMLFSSIGQAYLGESIEEESVAQQIEMVTPWMEQVVSEREDASLKCFAANVLRKLNQQERALEMAQQAYKQNPTHHTAVVVALCHRSLQDMASAFEAYELALSHDDSDVSVRLDLGDILCEQGKLEEGIARYQEVLDRQPDHPWASAYLPYYRFKLYGQFEDIERLIAQVYANNEEAQYLLYEIRRSAFAPYQGFLPSPADATINMLIQMEESEQDAFFGSVQVTAPEAASVQMVLRRLAEARGQEMPEYNIAEDASYECWAPADDVVNTYWQFDGNIASATVAPPNQVWSERIVELVGQLYILPLWLNYAEQTHPTLTPDDVEQLCRAMVHPPATSEYYTEWMWVYLCQFAAGTYLAASVDPEQWEQAPARQALYDLINGPMDWSVESAFMPLCERVLRLDIGHPWRADVIDWMIRLMLRMPKDIHVCYIYALFVTLLRFDELPDSLKKDLGEALDKMLE